MRGTNGAVTSLSGIATATNITDSVSALETYGDGHWAEQGGLTKEAIRIEMDINSTKLANLDAAISSRTKPADTQAKVALVDVTTLNSDMRGTDGAATAANLSALNTTANAIKQKTDTLANAGAITWGYTLTDADTHAPIEGADIWVTSDNAGAFIIASGITNSAGVVTFFLNAGTVYVWRSKNGYDFINPQAQVIS
jgi:hypothetical protein